jgi:hypothetical protein
VNIRHRQMPVQQRRQQAQQTANNSAHHRRPFGAKPECRAANTVVQERLDLKNGDPGCCGGFLFIQSVRPANPIVGRY